MRRKRSGGKYQLKFWDVEEGAWILVTSYATYPAAIRGQAKQIEGGASEDDLDIFHRGKAVRPALRPCACSPSGGRK